MNQLSYIKGLEDGRNSRGMNNPIHNNWPQGAHFNTEYEEGYWSGYQEPGLFNVWTNSQAMKTTIIAPNNISARQIFALRHGWLSDKHGYTDFVNSLNVELLY